MSKHQGMVDLVTVDQRLLTKIAVSCPERLGVFVACHLSFLHMLEKFIPGNFPETLCVSGPAPGGQR